jgi:hypothetical protein
MRMNWIPMFWAVPIYAGGFDGPRRDPPFVTPATRIFRQVSHKYLSKVRMRLFFEEVLE